MKNSARPKGFEAYIEFSRAIKNREQLKEFEAHCRRDFKMKAFFDRVEGRKFIFVFKDKRSAEDFLLTAYNGFVQVGLNVEKIIY